MPTTPPRIPLVVYVVGTALGLGVIIAQKPPAPFVWLIVAAGIVNVLILVWARRRARRGHIAPKTGDVVAPPTRWTQALPARWVGGGNLPGHFGRTNATWPLVVLELSTASVTVSVRPAFLGGMFGSSRFTANPSEVAEIAPVRVGAAFLSSTGIFGSLGIGILPANGDPIVYYWCVGTDRSEILDLASRAGFTVSWEERRARMW